MLGFVLLVKGADLLVDGSSAIAVRFKVSNLVIGLTIVSFGTSLPELVVNLFASAGGNTDLAIANIIGSNIANILLILGVSALIAPLVVTKGTVWKEIPFSLLAVIVLGLLANDVLIDGRMASAITRADGFVFISFLAIFLYYVFGIAQNDRKKDIGANEPDLVMSKSVTYVLLGLVGLILGGQWVVAGAIEIATVFGLSETFIGITAVALGTSLPELVASVIAVRKNNVDLAIGNAVGSNIFNVFWILGISAVIRPLPFNPISNLDLIMVIGATLLLFIVMFIGKKHTLQRWQGGFFIFAYVAYIIAITIRG